MKLITGLKLVGALAVGAVAIAAAVKLYAEHDALDGKGSSGLSLLAGKALVASHVAKMKEALVKKSDLFDYDPVAKAYFDEIIEAWKKEKDLTLADVKELLSKCHYIKIHVLDVV